MKYKLNGYSISFRHGTKKYFIYFYSFVSSHLSLFSLILIQNRVCHVNDKRERRDEFSDAKLALYDPSTGIITKSMHDILGLSMKPKELIEDIIFEGETNPTH